MLHNWWTLDFFVYLSLSNSFIFIISWTWHKHYLARPTTYNSITPANTTRSILAQHYSVNPAQPLGYLYIYLLLLALPLHTYWYDRAYYNTAHHLYITDYTWIYLYLLLPTLLLTLFIYITRVKYGGINVQTISALSLLTLFLLLYMIISDILTLVILLECQGTILILFLVNNTELLKRTTAIKTLNALARNRRAWRINILLIQFWANFFGALALILFGLSVSTSIGTVHWEDIATIGSTMHLTTPTPTITLCWLTLWLICGLAIKISAFPFHFWKPELYRNLAYPSIFIYASIYTFALMLLITYILQVTYQAWPIYIKLILWVLIILTVYFVTTIFFSITDIKLFLAYTSTFHVLYIFTSILADTTLMEKAILYNITYLITTLTIFSVLLSIKNLNILFLTDLQTIMHNPLILFFLISAIASMAGLPPLLGFWSKFAIILGLWHNAEYILVIHTFCCSLIIMYFYFANYRFAGAANLRGRLQYTTLIPSNMLLSCGTVFALLNFCGLLVINDLFNYATLMALSI